MFTWFYIRSVWKRTKCNLSRHFSEKGTRCQIRPPINSLLISFGRHREQQRFQSLVYVVTTRWQPFKLIFLKMTVKKLTEEHALDTACAGGSLYGLWQSNGNPVINVAFSDSLPRRVGINEHLVNNFGLCHIGEWRPIITAANDSGESDCQRNAR